MTKWLWVVLLMVPFFVMADARFVEAPAECHVPWDNTNIDNEFKLQSCAGVLTARGGGGVYYGHVLAERKQVPGGLFVIDGEDVRDVDQYPSGHLQITTSGAESGTDCNIVDANGTTYSTRDWTAYIGVSRTKNKWRVDVTYDLTCSGALQAQ